MNHMTSFGMKMNNQAMNQKDKVGFGGPFFSDLWDFTQDVAGFCGKVVGTPIGWISNEIHEGVKSIIDEPSTPREREARQIVNTYTTGNAVCALTVGQVTGLDAIPITAAQTKMVREIGEDAYNLSERELEELGKEVRVDICAKYGAGIGGGTMVAADLAAKKAGESVIAETANQIVGSIPFFGPIVKSGTASSLTKILGEDTIKACKKIVRKRN
ncbi:MAG: hypothetical protein BHV87_03715 [Clostridiales bacterium 36_14]|nr:MAG: hypothetical protein BHV87_03715 [Clostridiales bacterium 36_14]